MTETASRLVAQRDAELYEVETEISKTRATLDKLDALPELKPPDLLSLENARRRLRTLESDRAASVAAVEAARARLAAAERERDLAIVTRVRADAARRRAALDATLSALAQEEGDAEEVVFALLERDHLLAKLRGQVADLYACVAAVAGTTLPSEERTIDLGPWTLFPTGWSGYAFTAVVKRVNAVRAARAAEEQERAAEEARRNAPDLGPSIDANGRPYYTPAQARSNPRNERLIEEARRDPHRALATFDLRTRALVAAQDEEAAHALEAAARDNAAGIVTSTRRTGSARDGAINIEPLVEYDPSDAA